MNTDDILNKAADEANVHEIVGQCYKDLSRAGRHMDAAELLMKHILNPGKEKRDEIS